ncbi:uncharacterized protein [Rutidosis leptorrhynchoides]|uniref:uncharacterized protein n=1 Tax=Rutidosis leptorrhynchoides TaxID=125765 RepID=UPI003A9957AA
MVENTRLNYIRNNQKILRVTPYANLYDAQESGHQEVSDIGNRVILPASFTGGARYLQQNYLDAMAIVRAYGHPDLFITFTCNPKWQEILRFLDEDNLNQEDRHYLYRIEFQKRGLPHAHICLFVNKKDKVPSPDDIDNFITAELPNKDTEPELYSIVFEFMIHGPCGPKHKTRPCMTKQGFCSKHFPKDFIEETHFDGVAYPRYKRRDGGNFVIKGTTQLDNRYVVPYNKELMKQFQAHMNVEWLQFHLPNHQPILYDADDYVDSVLSNPSVGTSQFIEWMRCNEIDENARQYTYVEFPRHYVWNKLATKWTRQKEQRTVGRINFVPPKAGETYYLRILLNKVKGPTCYEDIRTVNNQVHDTFKEACYALGLLEDDREYVASIKETHEVASDENELKKILYNLALAKIERMLNNSGNSLKNIPNMPFPDYEYIDYSCNMMIQDEISYDI